MDRRSFFRKMIGGVAAAAAVRTFPFRVYSFPTEVKPVTRIDMLSWQYWGTGPTSLENVQAVELESFRKEIPDLLRRENSFYNLLKAGSVITMPPGLRAPFRGSFTIDKVDYKRNSLIIRPHRAAESR